MIDYNILENMWIEHQRAAQKNKYKPGTVLNNLLRKFLVAGGLRIFKRHMHSLQPDGSKILVKDNLNMESINTLFRDNSVLAIRVPGFCSNEVARKLGNEALKEYANWKLGGKIVTDMCYAGGSIPKEVACNNKQSFIDYFLQNNEYVNSQRELSNQEWPVDRLIEQLSEFWLGGAKLGSWLGQTFRPAITRVMDVKHSYNQQSLKTGFIHTDNYSNINSTSGLFSANIYLNIPEEGGELHIWNVNMSQDRSIRERISSKIFRLIQASLFNITIQKQFREFLPEPYIIKPELGDLIIFNTSRPHSVSPILKGKRVSIQLFIRKKGQGSLEVES